MKADISQSTIAALATAPGVGAIAIVRLSGTRAHELALACFNIRPEQPVFYHFYTGFLHDCKSGLKLDQVMLVLMPAGRSYTGEAMAEIHCHGGFYNSQRILSLFYDLGAVPAAPGEFTRRAYLNGRIDLVQAEAVAAMIAAESEAAMTVAADDLAGGLSAVLHGLLADLEKILARLEVEVDLLAEEGDNYQTPARDLPIGDLLEKINSLLAGYQGGRLLSDGCRVVFCGRPNVGKSSLMNALVAEERVLVSAEAGTTRDVVRMSIEIAGVRLELADTAGFSDSAGLLEQMGIERSRRELERADLVLFVLDGSMPLSESDFALYRSIAQLPHLVINNKNDLAKAFSDDDFRQPSGSREQILSCNVRDAAEIEKLRLALTAEIKQRLRPGRGAAAMLTRRRHYEGLKSAAGALEQALELIQVDHFYSDMLADELQQARLALLALLGREQGAAEDLLDVVFADFCVGK